MGWVTDRSKCTLEIAFDAICDSVKRDMEEARKLIHADRLNSSFHVKPGKPGLVRRVYVTAFPIDGDGDRDERTIKFELYKDRILIDRSGAAETLPELSNLTVNQKWSFAESDCLLCGDVPVDVEKLR